jgi:hypothetical protein
MTDLFFFGRIKLGGYEEGILVVYHIGFYIILTFKNIFIDYI